MPPEREHALAARAVDLEHRPLGPLQVPAPLGPAAEGPVVLQAQRDRVDDVRADGPSVIDQLPVAHQLGALQRSRPTGEGVAAVAVRGDDEPARAGQVQAVHAHLMELLVAGEPGVEQQERLPGAGVGPGGDVARGDVGLAGAAVGLHEAMVAHQLGGVGLDRGVVEHRLVRIGLRLAQVLPHRVEIGALHVA